MKIKSKDYIPCMSFYDFMAVHLVTSKHEATFINLISSQAQLKHPQQHQLAPRSQIQLQNKRLKTLFPPRVLSSETRWPIKRGGTQDNMTFDSKTSQDVR